MIPRRRRMSAAMALAIYLSSGDPQDSRSRSGTTSAVATPLEAHSDAREGTGDFVDLEKARTVPMTGLPRQAIEICWPG